MDHNSELYTLLPPTHEQDPSHDLHENPMEVLLDALDHPPRINNPSSSSELPSLASYLQNDLEIQPTTGAGMSISSLLAASQQLASPRTTALRSRAAHVASTSDSNSAHDWTNLPGNELDSWKDSTLDFNVGTAGHYELRDLEKLIQDSSNVGNAHHSRELLLSLQEQGQSFLPDTSRIEARYQPLGSIGGPSVGTRRWEELDEEERREKIRAAIIGHAPHSLKTSMSSSDITTILCLHASIAQKSYAKEKRYLCPPPLVRLEGPLAHLLSPTSKNPARLTAAMSILSDQGELRCEEKAILPEEKESKSLVKAKFGNLWVLGTGKEKNFSLQLSLRSSTPLPQPEDASQISAPSDPQGSLSVDSSLASPSAIPSPALAEPLACFSSSSVAIISKPSKKTEKARNTTSCILAGESISLFSRINSQTVRTKYMCIDDQQHKFCARRDAWTAFSLHVLRRAADAELEGNQNGSKQAATALDIVTYGSEVMLTDLMTGVSSDRLVIRKVEKGQVMMNAKGPVGQFQKLALCRVSSSPGGGLGEDLYLSAALKGFTATGMEVNQIEPEENHKSRAKRRKTEDGSQDLPTLDELDESSVLVYVKPTVTLKAGEGAIMTEEVMITDAESWTVTGITSFSYQFFDTCGSLSTSQPALPITPFPSFNSPPHFDAPSHTLTVEIANFFYSVPGSNETGALELWLGSIGPLKIEVISRGDVEIVIQGSELVGAKHSRTPGAKTLVKIDLPSFENIVRASGDHRPLLPVAPSKYLLAPSSSMPELDHAMSSFDDLMAVNYYHPSSASPGQYHHQSHQGNSLASGSRTSLSNGSDSFDRSRAALTDTLNDNSSNNREGDILIGSPSNVVNDSLFLPQGRSTLPAPFATSSSSFHRRIVTPQALQLPLSTSTYPSLPPTNSSFPSHHTSEAGISLAIQPDLGATSIVAGGPASLPLIMIRPHDGIGYLSTRWVIAEGDTHGEEINQRTANEIMEKEGVDALGGSLGVGHRDDWGHLARGPGGGQDNASVGGKGGGKWKIRIV